MMRAFFVMAAAVAAMVASPSFAWSGFGHRTVADIAMENVAPATRARIDAIFRAADGDVGAGCDLANMDDAATWPDCIRRVDGFRNTAPWHYQTHDVCLPYAPDDNCEDGDCVNAAIETQAARLADQALPANERLRALSYVVHMTGDVHQPLHSGDHEDRGGNDVEASYGIVPGFNLHAVWDGPLAERAISAGGRDLVRRYSEAERRAIATGDPGDWGRESWEIGRGLIYPRAADGAPCAQDGPIPATVWTEADIEASVPVVQDRIRQAGLRLARLLNTALSN
ncbi:S1/P1 nuclease [Croceicoccus hydrothermalis]|uniref:S1/P1 nuclease n=1 Tax=Croceicoccus hydrothermalis TaxID=2867964 RepID=UPI001EFBA2FC|nr:S1/P1 nuclease [Croceicoccus hydrothermalis]